MEDETERGGRAATAEGGVAAEEAGGDALEDPLHGALLVEDDPDDDRVEQVGGGDHERGDQNPRQLTGVSGPTSIASLPVGSRPDQGAAAGGAFPGRGWSRRPDAVQSAGPRRDAVHHRPRSPRPSVPDTSFSPTRCPDEVRSVPPGVGPREVPNTSLRFTPRRGRTGVKARDLRRHPDAEWRLHGGREHRHPVALVGAPLAKHPAARRRVPLHPVRDRQDLRDARGHASRRGNGPLDHAGRRRRPDRERSADCCCCSGSSPGPSPSSSRARWPWRTSMATHPARVLARPERRPSCGLFCFVWLYFSAAGGGAVEPRRAHSGARFVGLRHSDLLIRSCETARRLSARSGPAGFFSPPCFTATISRVCSRSTCPAKPCEGLVLVHRDPRHVQAIPLLDPERLGVGLVPGEEPERALQLAVLQRIVDVPAGRELQRHVAHILFGESMNSGERRVPTVTYRRPTCAG